MGARRHRRGCFETAERRPPSSPIADPRQAANANPFGFIFSIWLGDKRRATPPAACAQLGPKVGRMPLEQADAMVTDWQIKGKYNVEVW